MQTHLGYAQNKSAPEDTGSNRRNGRSRKTVQSELVATRKSNAVVAALKRIHPSAREEEAAAELDALEAEGGEKYRAVVRLWRGNWDNVIPFFQFLPQMSL